MLSIRRKVLLVTSIAPYLYIAQCESNPEACGAGGTQPMAPPSNTQNQQAATQEGVATNQPAPQREREQGSPAGMIIMLLVLFAVFYFIGLRPQQKQAKKHRELMGSIHERDKVITSAGILGTVTKMEGEIVTLQLDKNTSIRMLKDHIRGKQAQDV